MQPSAGGFAAREAVQEEGGGLWERLADSHCHPQEDAASPAQVRKLNARCIAVMATRRGDWEHVANLYEQEPDRVIPCFGVHPWWSHLHAMDETQGEFFHTLESSSEADILTAQEGLCANGKVLHKSDEWQPELRRLLEKYPTSIVGEFGLDRAAAVLDVGVKGVMPSFTHQLALTHRHLELATEFNRPVSMHCVRCYGHLDELFRRLSPEECPPKVMLHSYGGSPEMIKGFTKMPKIGKRFYFSFSHVINQRGTPQKLVDRIRNVPDDRLLLESDQVSAHSIDSGLLDICRVVADIKGWSMEETARITFENFSRFYEGYYIPGTHQHSSLPQNADTDEEQKQTTSK